MDNTMLGKVVRMIVTVPCEVLGTLVDLLEKLSGSDSTAWFTALKRFLRKENPWITFFPRAITLGIHKSVDAYITAMGLAGLQISPYGREILAKTPISQTEVILDLVERTTKELTGKDQATIAEVFAGAARLGLDKCPAEVGPACRLADKDQPKGERYLIGMKPVADSGGRPGVFDVARDGHGQWLSGYWFGPASVWYPDNRWVFCRRKSR